MASQASAVKPAVKMVLAHLGLDAAPAEVPVQSAFLKQASPSTAFSVPTSAPYTEELQRCWTDPRRFSHLPSDCRVLANMQGASRYGLDRMPSMELALATLILSPDEALRPDARCPWPQCRLTGDFIGKSYDAAARVASIGNSMSHLILALSQTLQSSGADQSVQSLSEASLQAFAYMTRELGRLMSSLTLTSNKVGSVTTLRALQESPPLFPCCSRTALGPAAQQALERRLQV